MTTATKRPDRSKTKRVPLGKRNRLTFDDMEEGYAYRVVNDKDERLKQAIEGGYEFVETKTDGVGLGDKRAAEASAIDSRISKPVGNGTTGFLMRIKQEWYDEDQENKEKSIKQTEAAMKPNTEKEQYGDGLENK